MKNFKNIILTGRAGSGKSELTHYLKSLSKEERIAKFHIGNFVELDDHPMLWNLGVTEDIWEQLGRKRQFTQNVGYAYNNAVPYDFFFKFLDLKLNRTIVEKYLSNPEFYDDNTLFIEFARGSSTGFRQTLNSLDVDILKETAIFFINNSYEESVRRNNARYEESKKNSILGHKVPDDFMENYYKINDWAEITEGKEYGYININGVQVPFITVWNEPETNDLRVTEERFAEPLKRLWGLNVYRNKIEEPKDIIKHFENMIIIGRPGSGKSEIVDLIKRAPLQKRMAYYYIGDFIEVYDFIWLNEKLKEDDFWE